jgi:protein gp37
MSVLSCSALDGATISVKLDKIAKVWNVLQQREDHGFAYYTRPTRTIEIPFRWQQPKQWYAIYAFN